MELYEHQKFALKQTENFQNVAYYLDMGMGKTYVGSEQMKHYHNRVNLVVCQKSKIRDWVEHFNENYNLKCFDLTKKKELEYFLNTYDENIVGVINYDLVWRRKELSTLEKFTLVLDESSLIQSSKSKRTKFIMKMKPMNVILLSGTPTGGRYENLVTQANLLGWKITKKAYWERYVNTIEIEVNHIKMQVVRKYKPYNNVEELKQNFKEHGAVFMKLKDAIKLSDSARLPEQTIQVIRIPASADYKKFVKNCYLVNDYGEFVGDDILSKRSCEKELCGAYSKEKLQAFKDILDSTDDRLIVFYNYTVELEALKSIVGNRPYSVVNGAYKNLVAYDEDDNSVTFIQYQAGAMGLNLQKANKTVYFTLPDGRSDLFEQSKKRTHRIGQTQPCYYYILVCDGTVEEEIMKTLDIRNRYTDRLFN